jgi:hypothetical protein
MNISTAAAVTDAFGVKMKSSLQPIQEQEVLRFNDVIRGVNSSKFDASFGVFNVPASHPNNSLYWMHVGIEAPPDASPRFQLKNSLLFFVKNYFSSNTPTFLSKSAVVQLPSNTSVSVNSIASGSVSVTTAYWSSFQLNNLMHSVAAVFAETFCSPAQNAQPRQSQNAKQHLNKIFYKHVIINEDEAWDANASFLTARYSGIYVFSINAFIDFFMSSSDGSNKPAADLPDTYSRMDTGFWLYTNKINPTVTKKQPVVQVSMFNQPRTIPIQLTVSASCLINLSNTDTVEVWLYNDYIWLPDIMVMVTSVSAFYYSPISNVQVILLKRFKSQEVNR